MCKQNGELSVLRKALIKMILEVLGIPMYQVMVWPLVVSLLHSPLYIFLSLLSLYRVNLTSERWNMDRTAKTMLGILEDTHRFHDLISV
jgi:hypothetical protein